VSDTASSKRLSTEDFLILWEALKPIQGLNVVGNFLSVLRTSSTLVRFYYLEHVAHGKAIPLELPLCPTKKSNLYPGRCRRI
jgi:hypothetical protein